MNDPWFSPEATRSLAFLSLLAIAAALRPLAERGRARTIVMGTYAACIGIGVVFLAAAAVAFVTGQPSYVLRAMLLCGFVIMLPFAAAFAEMQRIYREAELRKTVAADL
jgi:hypothetical protein